MSSAPHRRGVANDCSSSRCVEQRAGGFGATSRHGGAERFRHDFALGRAVGNGRRRQLEQVCRLNVQEADRLDDFELGVSTMSFRGSGSNGGERGLGQIGGGQDPAVLCALSGHEHRTMRVAHDLDRDVSEQMGEARVAVATDNDDVGTPRLSTLNDRGVVEAFVNERLARAWREFGNAFVDRRSRPLHDLRGARLEYLVSHGHEKALALQEWQNVNDGEDVTCTGERGALAQCHVGGCTQIRSNEDAHVTRSVARLRRAVVETRGLGVGEPRGRAGDLVDAYLLTGASLSLMGVTHDMRSRSPVSWSLLCKG